MTGVFGATARLGKKTSRDASLHTSLDHSINIFSINQQSCILSKSIFVNNKKKIPDEVEDDEYEQVIILVTVLHFL